MPVTINGSGPVTGVTAITGAGLDLIAVESFSAVSSVSVNNCFSATYDNYRVVAALSGSTTLLVSMRLRVSGTDSTASSYSSMLNGINADNSAGTLVVSASTSFSICHTPTTNKAGITMDFHNPFMAEATILNQTSRDVNSLGTQFRGLSGGHVFTGATGFDGFTLFPASGTITGTLRVYGYRNS